MDLRHLITIRIFQVYAGLLLKRMIHVQAINRHKRSVSEDTGSFAGSSFLDILSFGGEKKDPTTDEVFSPQSLPAKALERSVM
jgi:hypothetical protein